MKVSYFVLLVEFGGSSPSLLSWCWLVIEESVRGDLRIQGSMERAACKAYSHPFPHRLLIFPMNFPMATLSLKEMGKFLGEGRKKSLPS